MPYRSPSGGAPLGVIAAYYGVDCDSVAVDNVTRTYTPKYITYTHTHTFNEGSSVRGPVNIRLWSVLIELPFIFDYAAELELRRNRLTKRIYLHHYYDYYLCMQIADADE